MIKFNLEFDSLDEVYDVAQLLLELERELNDDNLLMKETKLQREEYLITLVYGYDDLEECIVERLEK